jgi:hypothetical protein
LSSLLYSFLFCFLSLCGYQPADPTAQAAPAPPTHGRIDAAWKPNLLDGRWKRLGPVLPIGSKSADGSASYIGSVPSFPSRSPPMPAVAHTRDLGHGEETKPAPDAALRCATASLLLASLRRRRRKIAAGLPPPPLRRHLCTQRRQPRHHLLRNGIAESYACNFTETACLT